MSKAVVAASPVADGRRARRETNRERVVDVLLGLFEEGHLSPPLDLVAERSGISHRSVFRYFEDLEQLHRIAIERSFTRYAHLLELADTGLGSLPDRIERLVDHRLALHEATAHVARIARLRAPTHPVLHEIVTANRSRLRGQLVAHFARELEDARPGVVLAASTHMAMETIDLMMTDHDPATVRESLIHGLTRLLTTELTP